VGLGFLVLGLGVRGEVLEVFGKGVGEGCLLDGFWWGVWGVVGGWLEGEMQMKLIMSFDS
jgi:hypothetical protein